MICYAIFVVTQLSVFTNFWKSQDQLKCLIFRHNQLLHRYCNLWTAIFDLRQHHKNDRSNKKALFNVFRPLCCGFKSHSGQLSIATSKNSSVVNTIYICSFLPNSCDCLRSEYIYFLSPGRLSGRSDIASNKVNFRQHIRQNFFSKKNEDIKSLCGS